MKHVFTVLAIIASIVAIIFSVLPISNLSLFPGLGALLFGLIAFYLHKKEGSTKKIITFAFLLTVMALGLSTYKSIFNKTEVGNTQQLIEKEEASKEEAIEELEDLDIEIEAVEIDE